MEQLGISIPKAEHKLEVEFPIASDEPNAPLKPQRFSCDTVCSFSKPDENISESEERSKSTFKLCGLIVFYIVVMIVEIVGGFKANSLAVLTDAAHLLSDVVGFSISLFTLRVSGWDATSHQSFGFNRIEVLGALLSVQLIWLISGMLIYEAAERILQKRTEVNGGLMFAIAAFGFVINFIMVMWLGHGHDHGHSHHNHTKEDHDHEAEAILGHNHGHGHGHANGHGHGHGHGHEHHASKDGHHHHGHENEEEGIRLVSSSGEKRNINIEGAYLHVMADMIQSVGVMVAGLVIWVKPDFLIVDLVCTLVFSIFALAYTIPMLKSIFCILMERTPSEIDISHLEVDLSCIKGVHGVHDLHVWAITAGKIVLASHVVIEPGVDANEVLHKVSDLCKTVYGIEHVTVQIEQE